MSAFTTPEILNFYRQPARMTDPGQCSAALEGLPETIEGLAHVVQGLLIHEHIAGAYGVTLTPDRRAEVHTRRVEEFFASILKLNPAPLTVARPPAERHVADCRHISVMLVSMLRSKGIPARARCGFATYFEAGEYVDHWVAEYWEPTRARWVMVDAQIDEVQAELFRPGIDLFDVPPTSFLVGGAAWRKYRSGDLDANRCGIMDLRGPWFIAGNLIRDAAALNNEEMLPWDVWGAMTQPGEAITAERLALFDELAELTLKPDEHFDEIRAQYASGDSIHVPPVVFNAVLNRPETV